MTRATSAIALLALVACSTNNTDSLNADDPIGRIAGQVKSVDGEALPGVEVQVAGVVAVTDADGFYTLEGVTPGDDLVVSFEEEGFARGYKKARLHSWETVGVDAVLTEIDGYAVFPALDGADIEIGKVKVSFDAGTIVDEFGAAYTGDVRVEVTYLDPSNAEDMKYAPGDLTALAYNRSNVGAKEVNEPAQLVSYGMADITLTNGVGGDLNIAEGSTAGVDFVVQNKDLNGNPMPATYVMAAGDTQQTWSFDTSRGVWVEEGQGAVYNEVEDITEERPVYEDMDIIDEDTESETYGEVIGTETVQVGTETVVIGQRETGNLRFAFEASHFSWWNCDQGFVPSCVTGQVTDILGFPVRSALVNVSGAQSSSAVYTDEDGYYVASAMVGDTVTVSGTTAVGGRNWVATEPSIFLGGYGSSASDCQPIDLEIEVCRESGIVMADNLSVQASTLDGADADQLRAWFWEPTGQPENCEDPWEDLAEDTCYTGTPDTYGARFSNNLVVGIHNQSTGTRTVGDYLEMRTSRDVYRINESDIETGNGGSIPGYIYETVTVTEGSMDLTENSIDLRAGDVIRAQSPGSASDYFGPIVNEEWMTVPEQVEINNVSGTLGSVNRTGGLDLRFEGKNSPDAVVVLVTQAGDEEGLLCKYADDGSVNLSGSDLGAMQPGWTSVSVYRPEFKWTEGPDGMPIRLQSMSGAILEADLQ